MAHITREADLIEEALSQFLAESQLLREELQRDGLAEDQIVCPIDLPHPAATEQTYDPVAL